MNIDVKKALVGVTEDDSEQDLTYAAKRAIPENYNDACLLEGILIELRKVFDNPLNENFIEMFESKFIQNSHIDNLRMQYTNENDCLMEDSFSMVIDMQRILKKIRKEEFQTKDKYEKISK